MVTTSDHGSQLSQPPKISVSDDDGSVESNYYQTDFSPTVENFNGDDLSGDFERLNVETADSIIGGSSVVSRSHSREVEGPDNVGVDEHVDPKKLKNQHKIFAFSLPFGGNPLSHLPSFKTIRHGLPIIGSSSEDEQVHDGSRPVSKSEIKKKLRRQESITSLEEALLFKDLKGADSSRFRAVRRAITKNISIPSIMSDGEKRSEPTVWDDLDGDIVILGGYRGSVLRDSKTGRRVWIPIRAGFNIKKIDLLIGPKDEDESHAEKEVYSDDMLTHIGPVDISRKLISKLKNGKTRVHTFGYDWRLSCDINSKRLAEFLATLESNKGENKKGAIVIAHSMGGLVAHHAMQENASLFRGLVYVGVPAECPNILGPIRFGDAVLFSNKILTPEANFFMRSSFVFLPKGGRCFIDRKTHERYDLDYFNAETWSEFNLSPLVAHDRNINLKKKQSLDLIRSFSGNGKQLEEFSTSYEDSMAYLQRTLDRTKKFLEDLEYNPEKKYPPLVIVYGNSVPTVRGAKVDGPEGIKKGDYFDFYYGRGDGVVHHKWLLPETRNFPVEAKIASEEGHISLMGDLTAMGDALESILLAEKSS